MLPWLRPERLAPRWQAPQPFNAAPHARRAAHGGVAGGRKPSKLAGGAGPRVSSESSALAADPSPRTALFASGASRASRVHELKASAAQQNSRRMSVSGVDAYKSVLHLAAEYDD